MEIRQAVFCLHSAVRKFAQQRFILFKGAWRRKGKLEKHLLSLLSCLRASLVPQVIGTDGLHQNESLCTSTCRTVLGTTLTKVSLFKGENPSALHTVPAVRMTKVPIFVCFYECLSLEP